MSDLLETLPDLDVKPYSHLLYSLRKNDITTTDLITLDPVDIARKCPLPLLDVRRLVSDVIKAMQKDNGMLPRREGTSSDLLAQTSEDRASADVAGNGLAEPELAFIKTFDPAIDKLLGGGIPLGYISEIAGESAVGKTQFLLGLLLSVQAPAPQGFGRPAIYLSTEDALNTNRLAQILHNHPVYQNMPLSEQPSFDYVHAMTINNLEAQEQVIEYQLPIAVQRYNAGLVVLDSVAANFRADQETGTATGLVDRATGLSRLGGVLRRIAIEQKVAVVVANQVSDRFAEMMINLPLDNLRSSSPAVASSSATQSTNALNLMRSEHTARMSLNHQQRFFTGWGDTPGLHHEDLKTPTLGLAWANQVSARIVLKVESEDVRTTMATADGSKRRRFMSLVFAPWTPSNLRPLEYRIEAQGLVSVAEQKQADEHEDLLDESLWEDDEEFP